MTKIVLLGLTVFIIILSCSTNKKIAEKKLLVDGWYKLSPDGIKKEFSGDTLVLADKPFISFNDIVSIKTELNAYLDTALEIRFSLTENGIKEWNAHMQSPTTKQIYFALDDTLINLYNLPTNSENNKATNLVLKLGYSDFSAHETERIKNKLEHRLKN